MPQQNQQPKAETKDEVVSGLADMVRQAVGSSEGGKSSGSSLPAYLIATAIAVIGFAIVGWLMVRAKRKAAQLAYELRKKEEEQIRAAEDHKLAKNGQERNEAHKKVKALEQDIEGLKKKLAVQEAAHAARAKALEETTSWDDLVVVDRRE